MKKNIDKKRSSIINFFIDVRKELPKIKWTSKKDVIKYSIATIVFIIFISLFFFSFDLLKQLVNYIKELL